jgi:hypothetical protein
MPSAARGAIFSVVGYFALLAWLNCAAIEQWERTSSEGNGTVDSSGPEGRRFFNGAFRGLKAAASSQGLEPRFNFWLFAAQLKTTLLSKHRLPGVPVNLCPDASCPDTSCPDASCPGFVSRNRMGLILAGVGALAAAFWAAVFPLAGALLLAGALSAMLLAWLDERRSRMNPVILRAAADLVLLTPAVLLLLTRMGR